MKISQEDLDELDILERRIMSKSSYEHFPRKCFMASVRDYHEFKSVQYHLKLADLNYEFEEIGCDGLYKAVFWLGKKPVRLIKLLKKQYEN